MAELTTFPISTLPKPEPRRTWVKLSFGRYVMVEAAASITTPIVDPCGFAAGSEVALGSRSCWLAGMLPVLPSVTSSLQNSQRMRSSVRQPLNVLLISAARGRSPSPSSRSELTTRWQGGPVGKLLLPVTAAAGREVDQIWKAL